MRYVKMFSVGFLLVILLFLAELLVTMPFSLGPDPTDAQISSWLVIEYALTAVPACLLSYLFAFLLKLRSRKDALLHAFVWTFLYAGVVFLLSRLDSPDLQHSAMIFGTWTLYLLFGLYFLGPVVYSLLAKKRDKPEMISG